MDIIKNQHDWVFQGRKIPSDSFILAGYVSTDYQGMYGADGNAYQVPVGKKLHVMGVMVRSHNGSNGNSTLGVADASASSNTQPAGYFSSPCMPYLYITGGSLREELYDFYVDSGKYLIGYGLGYYIKVICREVDA